MGRKTAMYPDFDQSLRELGVGDLSVGKKIKQFARGFYGRIAAYQTGLDNTVDDSKLERALARNLYGDDENEKNIEQVRLLAAYIRREVTGMASQHADELMAGVVNFGYDGLVQETKYYTLEDGWDVELVARETPTEGQELNLIQQLLGNIGRFSNTADAQ